MDGVGVGVGVTVPEVVFSTGFDIFRLIILEAHEGQNQIPRFSVLYPL